MLRRIKNIGKVFVFISFYSFIIQANLYSQTKQEVLSYLSSLPSQDKIVIGQQCGDGNNIDNWAYVTFVLQLHKETGEYPGIIGADYGWKYETDPLLVNETLKTHANHGGIVEITWHARNPWTGGDVRDNLINFDMNELITPDPSGDSTVHDKWLAELDKIAMGLQDLQDEDIVVLWRPLHEMNGGWFWWGKKTQTGFTNVWKHMHDYFTYEKNLDNLIWVYSVTPEKSYTEDVLFYYPGDEFVDIVGEDIYDPDSSPRHYDELIAETGKPYALAEYGPNSSEGAHNMNTLLNTKGKACYWLQWHTWDAGLPTAIIDNTGYDEVMNHEDVITASEIFIGDIYEYDTTNPEPPSISYSNLTSNSVFLSWNTPTDESGIDSYYIFKDNSYEVSTMANSILIENLTDNVTYSFAIRAKDSAGNFSEKSDPIQITTMSSTSIIDQTLEEEIKIYPNPVSNALTVFIPQGNFKGIIYTMSGEAKQLVTMQTGKNVIDVSHYKPGFYYIMITDNHMQFFKLFYKK